MSYIISYYSIYAPVEKKVGVQDKEAIELKEDAIADEAQFIDS